MLGGSTIHDCFDAVKMDIGREAVGLVERADANEANCVTGSGSCSNARFGHLAQREIVWPFAALGSMRIALCRCLPDDPVALELAPR
jgi:hypothetical protein